MMTPKQFREYLGYADTLHRAVLYLRNQWNVALPHPVAKANADAREILIQAQNALAHHAAGQITSSGR